MKYERILKSDWSAKWIWDSVETDSKNVWLCFNKAVEIDKVPSCLNACIAAENKYILYINGEAIVRDGGIKRGPTPDGCYFDELDIAPYLIEGENLISVLVWYWGKKQSFSGMDAGQGGLLFEATGYGLSILSDKSWKVIRNPAFKEDTGGIQPNFRLPESNVYYDARDEICGWNKLGFDFSDWRDSAEYDAKLWGKTYRREIPMFKDYGVKEYVSSFTEVGKITLRMPYNAQIMPYLKVNATAGKTVEITTDNTVKEGAVHSTYITKEGMQEFESPIWYNGEYVTYTVPEGVSIISLGYRESGYNTEFCGDFRCSDEMMNVLWQKSLRTLYVTMRDNFMDCPDRERAQWWGDATNEMMMSMYSLDEASYLLYRKGVSTMLAHTDPETKVLRTVVPTMDYYCELPMQQLAGICGFLTYYKYTGEKDFLRQIYRPAMDYLDLWSIGEDGLVVHRCGSWDWPDWGDLADVPVLENAWYYYAMYCMSVVADVIGEEEWHKTLRGRMEKLYTAYQHLWRGKGFRSDSATDYDDRGNAVAVLAGLCPKKHYGDVREVLFSTRNSSPYMEYYVLEALCRIGDFTGAKQRICERYDDMVREDYSTLWELWGKDGTLNHAWTGGPMVIMSKHFAGIKPLDAGYLRIGINPRYELDRYTSCTVPSVIGEIKLSYRTEGDHTQIEIAVPNGRETVLHLPLNQASVYLCGKLIFDDDLKAVTDGVVYSEADRTLTIR